MLDQVIDFLNGKTGDIKKQLKEKMNKLAEELKFEDALVVRNQLTSVTNMEKELITSLDNDKDIDIFGIAEQDETFAVNVMMIRGGKNLGQVNYLLENAIGDKNELLLSFISNYYSEKAQLVKEIVALNLTEENSHMLQEFMLSHFGKVVRITIPKIGVKKELVENSEKNAKEYLEHSKERIAKKEQMTSDALNNLKKLLNLKIYYLQKTKTDFLK